MTNAELDTFLCEKYPKMFADRHKSPMETCLAFGLEIGPGWGNILKVLCSQIQWHIDQSIKSNEYDTEAEAIRSSAVAGDWTLFTKHYATFNPEYISTMRKDILTMNPRIIREIVPQVVVGQVKEKFGTLRFYYSGGDEYIHGLVSFAEGMTGCTCEECGNPGRRSTGGWIQVRCEEHGRVTEEDEVDPQ